MSEATKASEEDSFVRLIAFFIYVGTTAVQKKSSRRHTVERVFCEALKGLSTVALYLAVTSRTLNERAHNLASVKNHCQRSRSQLEWYGRLNSPLRDPGFSVNTVQKSRSPPRLP